MMKKLSTELGSLLGKGQKVYNHLDPGEPVMHTNNNTLSRPSFFVLNVQTVLGNFIRV